MAFGGDRWVRLGVHLVLEAVAFERLGEVVPALAVVAGLGSGPERGVDVFGRVGDRAVLGFAEHELAAHGVLSGRLRPLHRMGGVVLDPLIGVPAGGAQRLGVERDPIELGLQPRCSGVLDADLLIECAALAATQRAQLAAARLQRVELADSPVMALSCAAGRGV